MPQKAKTPIKVMALVSILFVNTGTFLGKILDLNQKYMTFFMT